MNGAEGPISGPCAAGAKPRIGPESAPARPTRARSGSPGFTNEDAGKRYGFPNRGAFQNTGPSPHETLSPDLAARAVGLELKGPPGNGPNDVNNPSDPTTAGDEGTRRSRGRARGRANEPLRLCKSGRRALQGQGSGGLRPLLQPPRGYPGGPRGGRLQGGRTGGNGRSGAPFPAGREIGALKRQLQKIADGVLDGAVLHGQAAVAVQALNAKARVLELERRWKELGEVEEKLLELERRLETPGRPS